jgi:hypothetical protein
MNQIKGKISELTRLADGSKGQRGLSIASPEKAQYGPIVTLVLFWYVLDRYRQYLQSKGRAHLLSIFKAG